MATTQFRKPTKAAVNERVATDDQIFKKLNKTINGLDKPVGMKATIQKFPEAVKRDGTVAQSDEDIKLIEGIPMRTPRGVLEYREEKEAENFPIKVPLETTKFEAESFYAAIHENFEHFLQGFDQRPLVTPNITVTAGPTMVREEVVISGADPSSISRDDDDEEINLKTASEEFGESYRVITEINSAGDLTGVVADQMHVVWKGIRYRFYNGFDDGGNVIDGDFVHTTEVSNGGKSPQSTAKKNPGPIRGLTNTFAGRNLEVFLKERDLQYTDIEVVPAAEKRSFTPIQELVRRDVWDDIEWKRNAEKDGMIYNKNTVIIDDVEYEPGDIMQPMEETESRQGLRAFLPSIHERWTEYHTHEVGKPAHRAQVYRPDADEIRNKVYEGRAIRGYSSGDSVGYFMLMEGECYKIGGGGVWYKAMVDRLPPPNNAKGENNYSEYHDRSYIAMDWSELRALGTPGNKPVKREKDPDARIILGEHYNGSGWNVSIGVGAHHYYLKGRFGRSGFQGTRSYRDLFRPPNATEHRNWNFNGLSYIEVPESLQITFYRDYLGGRYRAEGPTYKGPVTKNLPSPQNDKFNYAVVSFAPDGIDSPAGYRGTTEVKRYFTGDSFYKKPHLARYNQLFE